MGGISKKKSSLSVAEGQNQGQCHIQSIPNVYVNHTAKILEKSAKRRISKTLKHAVNAIHMAQETCFKPLAPFSSPGFSHRVICHLLSE